MEILRGNISEGVCYLTNKDENNYNKSINNIIKKVIQFKNLGQKQKLIFSI